VCCNPSQHGFRVLQDLIVGKPDNGQVSNFEFALSLGVLLDLLPVYRAIDFDDKCRLSAVEVDEEAPDRVLPPKACTSQLATPECLPEACFSGRGCCAEVSRRLSKPGPCILCAEETLNEFHRDLTRVVRVLHVIVLHVRDLHLRAEQTETDA